MERRPKPVESRYLFRRVTQRGGHRLEVRPRNGGSEPPALLWPTREGENWRFPGDADLPERRKARNSAEAIDAFIAMAAREEHRESFDRWANERWFEHRAELAGDPKRWILFLMLLGLKAGWAYLTVWQWDLLPLAGMRGYPILENLPMDLLKTCFIVLPIVLVWPPAMTPTKLRRSLEP